MGTPRTLLVDIGGTLLRRTRPGPVGRALTALSGLSAREEDGGGRALRDTLAGCLLTGADRETGLREAAEKLRLSAADAAALREAVGRQEGEQVVLPGAVDLLTAAREAGWRTLAVSNVASWCDELPAELAVLLDGVVTSCGLGVRKQDDAFWQRLVADHGVSPAASVVVGDSPVPDGEVPAAHGFCPLLLGEGRPGLPEIAGWLGAAADPPPGVIGAAAGGRERWGGQPIVEVPHLAPHVVSVTRCRVRVALPGGRVVTSTVVRRRGLPAALLLPTAAAEDGILWLAPVVDRRSTRVPADLEEALTAAGISLDGMPDREIRHLVSMVREAKDAEVRRGRITDIVAFLNPSAAGGDRG